jgi:hypothetical protein
MSPKKLAKLAAEAAELLKPEKLTLPARPKVVEIRVKPYQDHHGYDAFEVWIILDDSTTDEDLKGNVTLIVDAIRNTLLTADSEDVPYTHFATRAVLRKAGWEV